MCNVYLNLSKAVCSFLERVTFPLSSMVWLLILPQILTYYKMWQKQFSLMRTVLTDMSVWIYALDHLVEETGQVLARAWTLSSCPLHLWGDYDTYMAPALHIWSYCWTTVRWKAELLICPKGGRSSLWFSFFWDCMSPCTPKALLSYLSWYSSAWYHCPCFQVSFNFILVWARYRGSPTHSSTSLWNQQVQLQSSPHGKWDVCRGSPSISPSELK